MSEQSPYEQWVGATLAAYHLERLLSQSALGPLFIARNRTTNATALLRILPMPAGLAADVYTEYTARLEYQASHLATLQHPYLLPLTDYGVAQGYPYLVWPELGMRSLSMRLAQSGPIAVVTVGRYLDQIAAALEYAHEHATLHGNLSTDCIYIQLDGQVAVSDVGVRQEAEFIRNHFGAATTTTTRYPYYGSLEACAPEQLLEKPVGTATDVYALAAVTYHLLTGQPVFTSDTYDAFLQQHLTATPAPLETRLPTRRGGLPAEIDHVLARGLAKDPAQRYSTPGAFANAFHQIIAPNSARRVPFPTSAPFGSRSQASATSGPAGERAAVVETAAGSGISRAGASEALQGASGRASGRLAPSLRRSSIGPFGRILIGCTLLVLVAGGGFLALTGRLGVGSTKLTGTVLFMDGPHSTLGHSDAVQITVQGLTAPPAGSHYEVWLINREGEQIVPLGALSASGQTYVLNDPGNGQNGQAGSNLLAAGDEVEVTLEQSNTQLPFGHIVLTGSFPLQAFTHIRHVLVSFPATPGKVGLLSGALAQVQELNVQAGALQHAAAQGDTVAVQCYAQNILDILEGTHGAHYQPLGADCAAAKITFTGDGFGLLNPPAPATGGQGTPPVLGYLDAAADHATYATQTPDATTVMRQHASRVVSALLNVKGWAQTADQEALKLLTTPQDPASVATLAQVCDAAFHGEDGANGRTAGATQSKAGTLQAYQEAQEMATLTLTAPPSH